MILQSLMTPEERRGVLRDMLRLIQLQADLAQASADLAVEVGLPTTQQSADLARLAAERHQYESELAAMDKEAR